MIKTTLGIEGMACGMCESHINDVIRNNFDVKKVSSSHKDKKTEILSEQPLDEQKLRDAITKTGYTLTAVSSEPYENKGFFGGLFGKS